MAKALNVSLAVTADTGQAKAALQALQSSLTQLSQMTDLKIGGSGSQLTAITSEIVKAQQAAGQLRTQLQEATNVNTGKLDLVKFNQSLNQSGMTISKYRDQLLTLGMDGEKAFAQLASAILKADAPTKHISNTLKEFSTAFSNTLRWQATSSLLHGMMGSIQHAFGYVQDLNESLNKIQIVTGASNENMAQFAKNANEAAKRLSTSTTTYTDASLIYYQQGLSDKEVAERTEVTIKMANAAGVSAQKVSDQMTAVWNNFDDGAHSLEYYADVMTALGAATASSTDEISTGLSKFASVADTVGLSYENAAAALATITATTRNSADTVGTGLRTLFSRLQSVKLGETLEDGVDLTKYSAAIATMGVNILDVNGELKSMDQIIDEMGAKWQYLNNTQKTAIAQTVGGVRQYTNLIALLDNYDFYKQNQQIALNSEGTVQKQADIYAQSWEAAQKRVKASAESIYSALIDDKFFTSLTDGFAKALDGVNLFIKGLGGIKGVLAGVLAIITSQQGNVISKFVDNTIFNIKGLLGQNAEAGKNVQQQMAAALQGMAGTGSYSGTITGELLSNQGHLYEQLVTAAERLNETERQRAASMYDDVAAMNESAIAAARKVDLAQQEFEIRKQMNQFTKVKDGKEADAQRYYQNMQSAAYVKTSAGSLTSSLNTAKINQSLTTPISANILSAKLVSNRITQMQNQAAMAQGLDPNNKTAQELLNLLSQLEQRIQSIKTDGKGMLDLDADKNAAQDLLDILDEVDKKSDELRNNAIQDNKDTFKGKGLETEGNLAAGLGQQEAEADNKVEAAQAMADAVTESIDEINNAPLTIGDKFSNAVNAISSVGMAISTVKSLMDTWNDDSLSIGDKLVATMTSGSMAVLMLANAYKTLGISTTISNLAKQADIALTSGSIATTTALGAANQFLATTFVELYAAMGPIGVALLAIAAIAVAVIGVIKGIQGLDRLIVTSKEKMEMIESATESAKEAADSAKQAYDNLLNDFDNHNKLLDTLHDLTAGTLEFQDALLNANAAAMDLINEYGLTGNEVTTGSNGELIITEAGYSRVRKEAQDKYAQAQQEYRVAEANETYYKAAQDYKALQEMILAGQMMGYSNQEIIKQLEKDKKAIEILERNNMTMTDFMAVGSMNDFLAMSGKAYKNRNALQAIAQKDGEVSDIEQVLVDQLAENPEFWERVYSESNNYQFQKGAKAGKSINLDTARNGDLIAAYKDLFSAEEYNEFIEDLKEQGVEKDEYADHIRDAIRNRMASDIAEAEYKAAEAEIRDTKIGKFAKKTNTTPIGKAISQIAQMRAEGFNTETEKIFAEQLMQKYKESINDFTNKGLDLGVSQDPTAAIFTNAIKKLSINDLSFITEAANTFGTTFGDNSARMMYERLTQEMTSGNTTLADIYKNIDWGASTIGIVSSFKDSFERANLGEEYKELTKTMIQDAGGMGSMLEELIYSEDFKKPLKTLQKQLDKTGKLGASDIESIVGQMEDLDSWLDVAGIHAETLGEILSSMMLGDLNLNELSDGLLEAMDIANELENNVGEVFAHIDAYKEERSIRDIGKFYKGLTETIEDSMGAGFLLDAPLLQDWGEIFGHDSLQAYKNWAKNITSEAAGNLSPEEISKSFQGTFGAEIAAMQSIQKNGNLSGVYKYALNKNAGGTYNGVAISDLLKFNEQTGQVITQNDENFFKMFKDQESFIDFLQDGLHLTEDMAKAMTAELQATDAYAHDVWGQAATDKAVAHLKEQEQLGIKEIETFAKRNSEFLLKSGQDLDDWVKSFVKAQEAAGKSVINLGEDFKHATAEYKDLKEAMQKSADEGMGSTLETYLANREKAGLLRKGTTKDGKEAYYLSDLQQAYEGLGGSLADANRYIEQSGDNVGMYMVRQVEDAAEGMAEFQRQFVDFDDTAYQAWAKARNYTEEELRQVSTLQEYANEMSKFADNMDFATSIADAITEGLTDLEITFKVGNQGEITASINKAIDDADTEVEVTTTTSDDINEQWKNRTENSSLPNGGMTYEANASVIETNKTLAAVSEALADLESAKAEAVSEVTEATADAIAQAKAEMEAAKVNIEQAIQQASEGQKAASDALLSEAAAHAEEALKYANSAKQTAEEVKATQKQMAMDAKTAAAESSTAAKANIDEMNAIIANLEAENQNYASLLQEAAQAAEQAVQAAGEAATAANEGLVAEAEAAAQRAEEAAARVEGIVATIQSKIDGQTTFEGETPTYTKEEQQGFIQNAGSDLKQDFQNIKDWFKGIGDALVPEAAADELTEAEKQMNQLGETANTVANDINGNPIHNEVDNTAIEDSIDALERLGEARNQLGQEAEANPVQLHASADVNDPDKAPGVYESYGLTYGAGSDDISDLASTVGEISDDVKNQAKIAAEQNRNIVEAYGDGEKRDYKGAPASSAEIDLVEQLQKGGFGTSKDQIKSLESFANSVDNMAQLPDALIDAVKTVQTEHGGEIDAERIQEVQAQVNGTAKVEVEGELVNGEEVQAEVQEAAGEVEVEVSVDEEELTPEDQTATVDLELGEQEPAEDETAAVDYELGQQENPEPKSTSVYYYKGGQEPPSDMEATVNYKKGTQEGPDDDNQASGRNNGNGRFAGGKHLGNTYHGLATVGELGPELMIHRGVPFLAGVNGRTVAYVEPNDEIYTAAQTQRILENNPTLWDLPGFSVGYNRVTWGNSGGGGGYGSGAKSSNKKSAKFDPERYHLISRQIDDINRRYERLDKISDKAFGKNKVKAIQDIIDVTDDLIAAQEQLISEANAYVNQDLATLRAYGVPVTLDEHGNLQNFEQLQEMYGRPATEAENNDQKEYYQTIWKAIQQYEESVDKLNEAYEKYDDLIYQLADLELEQFTARVEMKIDYDDKSLKLLDHYIDKINDDIYKTAEVFELTESKLNTNLHKLDSYYDGIEKIMMTLHDQDGNLIKGMSLDKFLGLTDAQRDALRVSSEDMEAIADYLEEMVDVMEEMDDEKLDWTEKLSQAFDELNTKVENGLNLFDHYQSLLENLSNISDLMGTGITPQSRKLLKDLNVGLLRNTQNSMIAAKDYLDSLEQAAAQTKWLVMNESDTELKQAYQEQLDEIEGMIRDTQENILSYWETMLEMAQDMYTNAIDQALQDYERSFAGLYVTLDRMGEAYDRRKEIQSQYVEDYEKYYQLSKLDRDIVKTIDELAANASKHSKNLTDLLNEVRELQKNGQKLSEYDIEVLEKKYELEKARAELEEAREAKTTVRLQRNRDGSWGYVYTADEDKISELEANLEEAIYNYQKLNDEQIHRLQDNMADFVKTMHDAVNDIMSDTTTTYEEKMFQLQELNKDFISQQGYLFSEINKAMNNQGSTYSRALDIYKGKTSELGDAFVDLEDTFAETVLAQILGVENLDVYKSEMTDNWNELLDTTKEALDEYQARVDDINKTAGTTTKNFYDDATKWIEAIGKTSGETTSDVQKLGDELSTQFKRIAEEAKDFAAMWKEKMREVTEYTEPFVTQLTSILGIMNDAYDAFGIADGTARQVYADRIVGSGRNNNGNITASDNGPASVYNPYADIEAQYLALQQQLEDQYAAYQNEILNYYNDVQNNIAAALGDLTNNWNSILNTQSSLMGYGLNTTPNLAGLMSLDSGWNQNINIAADFPGVTSSFEIEEAFNNLVNKATQYANRW